MRISSLTSGLVSGSQPESDYAYINGVPARLVPDNLKAAIVRASFTEPVAQRAYRECAAHYDFLIDPQPPRAPWLKEWVSYCTSLASFEDNLGQTRFVLPFGRERAVGDMIEPLAFVVVAFCAHQPAIAPAFDRVGTHAQALGQLPHREQSPAAQPRVAV